MVIPLDPDRPIRIDNMDVAVDRCRVFPVRSVLCGTFQPILLNAITDLERERAPASLQAVPADPSRADTKNARPWFEAGPSARMWCSKRWKFPRRVPPPKRVGITRENVQQVCSHVMAPQSGFPRVTGSRCTG